MISKKENSGIAQSLMEKVLGGQIGRLAAEVQAQWTTERNAVGDKLYNGFVSVINENKPSLDTAIWALEQVKLTLLMARIKQETKPGETAALSERIPKPMTGTKQSGVDQSTVSG